MPVLRRVSPYALTIDGMPTSIAPYALTTWQPKRSSIRAATCGCRYAPPVWITRSAGASPFAASMRTVSVGSVHIALTRWRSSSSIRNSIFSSRGMIVVQPVITVEQSPLM